MKFDLTQLFYDYIQNEENLQFRRDFWSRPENVKADQAIRPVFQMCSDEQEDSILTFASRSEEFGFMTGFQLALKLIADGVGAAAPKMEVQG